MVTMTDSSWNDVNLIVFTQSLFSGANWYNFFFRAAIIREHEMCEKGKNPIVNVNL